jgi:phosphate-selective porin OprO/OprP
MRTRGIALAATILTVAWCSDVRADEEKEKELERKLAEMQRQIDEMSKRLGDGGDRSDDELEQRVAELEKVTKKDQDGLFAYWKNGIRLDSVDGAFKLSIFGRAQLDFTFWDNDDDNQDAIGETNSSTEFRRVRLGMGGTIYKNVEYKAEFDFADQGNGTAAFADVFMQLNNLCGKPVHVRVGHFDEPFSIERLTSSKYFTFAERSLVEGAGFTPSRNTGVMVFGNALENRLGWFAGGFRDTNVYGNDIGPAHPGQHGLTARVAGRPWVHEDGTKWVHVGAAATRRNPNNETVQFRARPEVHVGPRFVDTGAMTMVDRNTMFDLEAAANFGPFHAQAEFVSAELDGADGKLSTDPDGEDRSFSAWSIQCGYFITGETREYDVKGCRWDRIKVKKNYGDGVGAWEVAVRLSKVDLNDADVEGGEMTDVTFGVNWYLNPNTKVMFNWIHFDPDREVTTAGTTYDLTSSDAFIITFRIDF